MGSRVHVIHYCHIQLHLGFSAKLKMCQVSACKMEPQSGFMIYLGPPTTHPPTHPPIPYPPTAKLFLFQCCAVSPPQLFPSSRKYVQCPPKCCSVSTPQLFLSSRRYVRCPSFQYTFYLCGVPSTPM